jgi:threonine/homoserine/homoserine lactone efflux protein
VFGAAIGEFLPSALAVALSPIPVAAVVLVLAGERSMARGWALAIGWMAGLVVVSVGVILVVGGLPEDGEGTALGSLRIALGVLFLVLAAKQWRRRPARGEEPRTPGWMRRIDHSTPLSIAGIGVVLSAGNPKNLALTLAAAASIAEAGLGDAGTVGAVAVFVAIGSMTIVGAVIVHALAPERSAGPLESVKRLMLDNGAVILMVVLLVLGAKLLGDGIADLSG